jgi:hypothetical protein
MARINVYLGADTFEALERRRAKLAERNQRLEVSKICEAALRKALRLKERK